MFPSFALLSLMLVLPGAVLLGAGLRRRTRGDAPHCARCNYVLTGLAGDRCPECGAELTGTRAVVRGERYRRRSLALAGAVLLLLGCSPLVAIGWYAAREFDWYRMRPASWVIDDVERAGSTRAMREIARRHAAGSLGAGHRDRVVELALAEQAKPVSGPITGDLVDFLGTAAEAGQLSNAQRQRFFEQMVRISLRAGPVVAAGDKLPFKIDYTSRGPSGGLWWTKITRESAEADGRSQGPSGTSQLSGTGAGGSGGSSIPVRTPGKHTLTARATVQVYHGRNMDEAGSRLLHERSVTLSAPYEVLDRTPDGAVKRIDDPSLAPTFKAALRPVLALDGDWLNITVEAGQVPVNAVFDVYVRAGSGTKEHRATSVTLRAGRQNGSFNTSTSIQGAPDLAAAEKLDVIFRGSEAAVRETADITETWTGELVYTDVPVTRSASSRLTR